MTVAVAFAALCAAPAQARSPVPVGSFATGPWDAITDVASVRVAHLTKEVGSDVRTGATAIVPNADPWNDRVAAATFALNGNGEMTGTHWVDQAGFLETPIVLTDTLDVGRADDGVVSWMVRRYPQIGVRDDVPLPVVAECDDQAINDIRGRHVTADDVVGLLDAARPGDFARGNVGAGTGMRAFGFAAGIGSASRVLPKALGGYTVGALVNANTGAREELRIGGVAVGRALAHDMLPIYPQRAAYAGRGRAADGSIIIVIATDAPLDHTRLRDVAMRAALGLARTGATSHVSSGDLFLAFSSAHRYPRSGGIVGAPLETDEDRLDALFAATADAVEAAIDDALFAAHDQRGRAGVTYFALPRARVLRMLPAS